MNVVERMADDIALACETGALDPMDGSEVTRLAVDLITAAYPDLALPPTLCRTSVLVGSIAALGLERAEAKPG